MDPNSQTPPQDEASAMPGGPPPDGMEMGPPPEGGGEMGPPPSDMDPREMRHFCFKMIREITGRLGWKYKLWIPGAVILSSVYLLPPRFFQYFTEGLDRLSETTALDFIKMLAIFGIGIAVCQWIALIFESIIGQWLRLRVSIELRQDAVEGLNRTRIDALDSANRGDWMTRMTGDLFNAEEFMTTSLPDQITNLTMLVGSAALFFWYSGPIAFIPILGALLLAWVNIIVQKKMGPKLGYARMLEGGVFQTMIETFEGLRTIRSYGGEKFTFGRISEQLKDVYKTGMSITKSMAWLMGTNEFVGQLIVTGILTLVAFQVRGKELTAADALIYPFYINMFLGAAKTLVGSAYDWNRFFFEGGRLASLLYDKDKQESDHEEIFGDFKNEIKEVDSFHVKDAIIAYGDNPPVIQNQDLHLSRGEIVAVVGPSGCGKSTMVECFAGLRHANSAEFEAKMKDGSTRDLTLAPPFLSAFVEQQPYLFVGTIRDNITLGQEHVTDDHIWESLEEVGLTEIVRSRGGLDHVLADRGRNMSVGQQYRLALCRALVCDRPFLLMDEPFAALDIESVDKVIQAMKEERSLGTGIILITHLLPPELDANRVVEMQPVLHENPGLIQPGHIPGNEP